MPSVAFLMPNSVPKNSN